MTQQWAARVRAASARVYREVSSLKHQEGQGLVEYAMILILVVIVAFIVVTFIGPWVGNTFSNVVNIL